MKIVFKKLSIALIVVGVMLLTLNYQYGQDINYIITKETIPNTNLTWFKLDTTAYIQNLTNTFDYNMYIGLKQPPQTWINNATLEEFFRNNMLLILNYIIYILNILFIPFRLIFYIIVNVLALLGVKTATNGSIENIVNEGGISWLVKLSLIMIKAEIPYVV